MSTWAHTKECEAENARRCAEGLMPLCICGEPIIIGGTGGGGGGGGRPRHLGLQFQTYKYRKMQQLLTEIASRTDDTPFQPQAKALLDGLERPRTPAVRAKDRAAELETLVLAYHLASGVFPSESPHLTEARTLIIEALKAWERAHPPAALDPLLFDR